MKLTRRSFLRASLCAPFAVLRGPDRVAPAVDSRVARWIAAFGDPRDPAVASRIAETASAFGPGEGIARLTYIYNERSGETALLKFKPATRSFATS